MSFTAGGILCKLLHAFLATQWHCCSVKHEARSNGSWFGIMTLTITTRNTLHHRLGGCSGLYCHYKALRWSLCFGSLGTFFLLRFKSFCCPQKCFSLVMLKHLNYMQLHKKPGVSKCRWSCCDSCWDILSWLVFFFFYIILCNLTDVSFGLFLVTAGVQRSIENLPLLFRESGTLHQKRWLDFICVYCVHQPCLSVG